MKLIIQSMDRSCIEIIIGEHEPQTVLEVKRKIANVKKSKINAIKLIYKAQILENDKRLINYNIVDGDKIIVIMQKGNTKHTEEKYSNQQNVNNSCSDEGGNDFSHELEQQTNDYSNDDDAIDIIGSDDDNEQNERRAIMTFLQNSSNLLVDSMSREAQNDTGGLADIDIDSDNSQTNINANGVVFGIAIISAEQKQDIDDILNLNICSFEEAVQYYLALNSNKEATINAILDNKYN